MPFPTCKEETLHGRCKQLQDFRPNLEGEPSVYCFYHRKIRDGLMGKYDPMIAQESDDE